MQFDNKEYQYQHIIMGYSDKKKCVRICEIKFDRRGCMKQHCEMKFDGRKYKSVF